MTAGGEVAIIRNALALLCDPGAVYELRAPNTRRGVVSGYFNDLDKLAQGASRLSGKAPGVYITINPVNLDLLACANNRVIEYAKYATVDSDIIRRVWFPIDFDADRPAGISSTDAQHEAALRRAREVREWLRSQDWPDPILADSGNGAHLLYPVDLPNDDASRDLLKNCLAALAGRLMTRR